MKQLDSSYIDTSLPDAFYDVNLMRQLEERYSNSSVLFTAVNEGNYSMALSLYHSLIMDISKIQRNHDPIRNAKNLCIIMNSMLRHSVGQRGIHPFLLDKLSNEIGMKIEQVHSVSELEKLGTTILQDYCNLVQAQLYPNCKPLIQEAIAYVCCHLSTPITASQTASLLHMNPDYFSHLFHTETGITFTAFVNQKRCHQAATLLVETTMPIHLIAHAVGYSNSSYFTEKFHEIFGCTPRNYRTENL